MKRYEWYIHRGQWRCYVFDEKPEKFRYFSIFHQYKLTSFNTILIDDISNTCLGKRSCFEGKVMTLQSLLNFFYLVSVVTYWLQHTYSLQGRKTCCQACGTRLLQALRDMCCSKQKTTLDNKKTDDWRWTSGWVWAGSAFCILADYFPFSRSPYEDAVFSFKRRIVSVKFFPMVTS